MKEALFEQMGGAYTYQGDYLLLYHHRKQELLVCGENGGGST